MHSFIAVFVVAIFALAGDYLLKTGSLLPQPYGSIPTLSGAALYFVSAFGWVYAMRRMNLTVVAVVYSSMTIIILTAMSLFVFKETVNAKQLVVAGLALVAILIALG